MSSLKNKTELGTDPATRLLSASSYTASQGLPEPAPVPEGEAVTPALIKFMYAFKAENPNADNVDEMIALVEARAAFGLNKYKQLLFTNDGRVGVIDAEQEIGDYMQYAFKEVMLGNKMGVEKLLAQLELARDMLLAAYQRLQ